MQLTFIRLCSAQRQPEPGLSEFGVLVEDVKWAASHSRNVIFNLIIYACNHATLVLAKEILKWESSGIWAEEFESSRVSWIYESYTIYKSSFGRSMENFELRLTSVKMCPTMSDSLELCFIWKTTQWASIWGGMIMKTLRHDPNPRKWENFEAHFH